MKYNNSRKLNMMKIKINKILKNVQKRDFKECPKMSKKNVHFLK